MNEIKKSALLSELLDMAKKVGNKKDSPITAEKFLVAVIDKLHTKPAEVPKELYDLLTAVRKRIFNVDKVQSDLIKYVTQENVDFLMDDLYMKKKLQQASKLAEDVHQDEITASMLLICILEDPNATIKAALALTDSEEPKQDGKEGNTVSFSVQLEGMFDKENTQPTIAFEEVTDAGEKLEDMLDGAFDAPSEQIDDIFDEDDVDGTRAAKRKIGQLVQQVKYIRKELQSCIFGQDNAINVFTTGYFQASMRAMLDEAGRRPQATFLFAGPPGVGKTFLAEKAAQALGLPFKRFDMSGYADKEANMEFCGFDKVYRSAKAGNVTSFVQANPKCVLLFDEIEKANISVIHLFLQMLDAGRLRDNFTDRDVSFADAIIILTTNAGKQLYEESESGDLSSISRKVIIDALEKDVKPDTQTPYFPKAICSRFASGNVVMFNHMGAHNLRAIAEKEIKRHAFNLCNGTDIYLKVEDSVYTALLFAEGSNADARTIRSRAEAFINDELYELLRLIESDKVKTQVENIKRICINVDLSSAKKEISELFVSEEKPKVLILSDKSTVSLCRKKAPKIEIFGVQTLDDAVSTFKNNNIDFALLDMQFGAQAESRLLNLEDTDTPARDFFAFLRQQGRGLPVYLIEKREGTLTDEEKVSFLRQGVRGVIGLNTGKGEFAKHVKSIASMLYQQASMDKLAKENKLVTFETAQTVSKNGEEAKIKLFDFKLAVAVDSEDTKNILSAVSKPNVRFEDVLGANDAKRELKYFVEYLKNPKKYLGSGVKAPKGILLYGPPGTGKTMLAKAMACEAGVTFIVAEGNQFVKKYLGEGAEKVHQLFKTARKYAPSILFIDEIDAIAKERRGGAGAGANGEETLTAFLTEMDGFISDPSRPVFVLAATNFDVEPGRPKSLDPALMRRFDRRVYIDLPNKEDKIKFLKMKIAKNNALDISDEQVENIATRAIGMSLAELDSAVELALRSAIRQGSTVVNDAIMEEAFETFNSGEVKKWDESQLQRVARHEAGHALLTWLAGEKPAYLTVVARENHGGYMRQAEQEGKAIYTLDELLGQIRAALGGRAAEIVYYGERDGISTGASGDLASATKTAQYIVCVYGMDEKFGLAVEGISADGKMSSEVREAVNRILTEQMKQAICLVSENKDKIASLVEALMNKNYLNSAEIEQALTKA